MGGGGGTRLARCCGLLAVRGIGLLVQILTEELAVDLGSSFYWGKLTVLCL
jgi:hypothetical protein